MCLLKDRAVSSPEHCRASASCGVLKSLRRRLNEFKNMVPSSSVRLRCHMVCHSCLLVPAKQVCRHMRDWHLQQGASVHCGVSAVTVQVSRDTTVLQPICWNAHRDYPLTAKPTGGQETSFSISFQCIPATTTSSSYKGAAHPNSQEAIKP